jgi:hypothetical protein
VESQFNISWFNVSVSIIPIQLSKFLHLRYSSDYHLKSLLPKETSIGYFAATVFQGTLHELREPNIDFQKFSFVTV